MNINKLFILTSIASTFITPFTMALASPLEGSWIRHCQVADSSDPESHYDVIRLRFSNDSFSSDIKNFSDSQCIKPFKYAPNPTASGKFSLGNSFVNAQNKTVTEIDTLITKFNGSPFDIKQFEVFIIQENKLYFSVEGTEDMPPSKQNRITEVGFSNYFIPL
jgi:hypothetical protein